MSTIASRSPQNPADVVLEAPRMTSDDVDAAFARARDAQRQWWAMGAAGRSAALHAAAEALAARADEATDLVVREVGKPLGEAKGEVGRGVSILRYFAQASFMPKGDVFPPSAGVMLWSERRPHGVVGLITPWNFPVAIPLWKAAPALCAGNAVVMKPSQDAIACALFLQEVIAPHLPAGLFQVVVGGGADVGNALTAKADCISFTGSTGIGRQIAQTAVARNVPVQAEMGGLNAAIVLADADYEKTAGIIAGAAMWFAGQKCTATSRVIVVGDGDFTTPFINAVESLVVGDPARADVTVGPLINDASLRDFTAALDHARASGGRILTGDAPADGLFVKPVVIDGLAADHPLSCNEVFGPIVTLHHAATPEAAIALANSTEYGLVTGIHGRDLNTVTTLASLAHSGLVKINASTSGVDFYAPFGGEKMSSYGMREQGLAALDFYSHTTTVTLAQH
jgi:acyl-CoA reductase-like NAD-dependent aldehyde dehydrogenase